MLKYQQPAQGILTVGEYGDSKLYKVVCDCGSNEHSHDVWVEADDTGVTVNIYVTVSSPFWSMNRWRQMWTLLTKGHLKQQTNLAMREQLALNYAETIKQAIVDVNEFKKAS